ncbi:MAG: hypothetical protein ACLGI7_02430 [Gammaproteobacteria bacterium]
MGDAEEEKPALVRAALLIRDEQHPAIEAARAFASAQGIELEETEPQALLEASPGRATQPHWVLAVGDERVAGLVALAAGKEVALGLLPAAGSVLPRLFDLPKTVDAQLPLAFSDSAVALDITRCNDEPVLGFVAIGDVPFLDARGRALVRAQPTRWRRWRIAAAVYWNAVPAFSRSGRAPSACASATRRNRAAAPSPASSSSRTTRRSSAVSSWASTCRRATAGCPRCWSHRPRSQRIWPRSAARCSARAAACRVRSRW